MGQKVYLTEQDLTKIIEESVKEILKENQENEFLGTALALGGLAAGASYLGKKRQQGYTPWKNAYNWAKSKINGTEYQRQVNQPKEYKDPKQVRNFQIKNIRKYRMEENIIIGVWGPNEQKIYDFIQAQKEEQNDTGKEAVQGQVTEPKFTAVQGGKKSAVGA